MRVQTGQIEALMWIARLGSFRAAAAQLGLTQPTISMRIRELERLLGVSLFDRASYRAALTESGRALAVYAERIVGLAEQMELQSAGRHGVPRGPIRMGAADTFALTCLPTLLSQMEQLLPGLRVDVQIDYSARLNQRLQHGELDLAFLTGPIASTTSTGTPIQVEPLARLPLAWVGSPRLRLPGRVLRPRDLQAQTILTNPRPSHLYGMIVDWFGGETGLPDRITTCNSLTIIARLASSGFGVALLPACILRSELELGTLRALRTDPTVEAHDLLLAYRKTASPLVLDTVRAMAAQLIQETALARG